ncbi:MAG: hypothetical protein ACTS4Y_01400 [Candidatus Hodgkinia cicadicola]
MQNLHGTHSFPPPPEAPSRESWSLSLGVRGRVYYIFFCCGRFKSGDFGWCMTSFAPSALTLSD